MKKSALAVLLLVLGVGLGTAAPGASASNPVQSFPGAISDSLCGFRHPMQDAKRCTLGCVKGFNATFVLADSKDHKVYQLSNQGKAKAFAGEDVIVTGTLHGSTIQVKSIRRAS